MAKSMPGGAMSAPACCSRIPILPIRYAIVPNAGGAAPFRYAESGFKLEMDFQKLQLSAYTLRAIRPGYVYVFMKGPMGEKLVVHEYDGEGHYQELTYTGLENYGRKNKYKSGTRMGWVWADTNPDTAKEVWIGYSPHLWTNAMTARIANDPKARQLHMRPLDMAELTSGVKSPSGQPHVLPATALTQWVEDFKPREQRLLLQWSSHASQDDLPIATFLAQSNHYPVTQPRVPAVIALHDAEGISLDLGLIASAYQHQITDLNRAPGKRGADASQKDLPDCLRLDVENVHIASSAFHHKNLTAILVTRTLRYMFSASGKDPAKIAAARGEWHRNQPTNRSIPSQEQLEFEVLTDERMSPSGARLAKRIDTSLYFDFLKQRQEADAQLCLMIQELDRACSDHDGWLSTAESSHKTNPKSLAIALDAFDRDDLQSAIGLELSIGLMLQSMIQSLSVIEDGDDRAKRLEKWIDDPDGPVYVALAAFNPFKDKADAVGTLLGASDDVISSLAAKFPAINGVTDLTAQTVTTVVLRRLKGETRWDASRNLRQQVLAAAREANTEKVLGLLAARYGTVDSLIAIDPVSQDVKEFLDKGMAEVKSSRVSVKGSRTVRVETTQTVMVKPTLKSLGVTAAGTGLNLGMAYFNIINLGYALKTLEREYSHESATNLASAIMGVIGSLGVAALSTRTAYSAVMVKLGYRVPGLAFSIAIKKLVLSKLFGGITGGSAILLGLLTDFQRGNRLNLGGNEIAGNYTYAGGISLALGSGMILGSSAIAELFSGAVAGAGTSAVVPVAGWIVAAVVLAGAALVAGSIWFHSQAAAEAHTPMELWVARSQFGNLKNDGERRAGLALDRDLNLFRYTDLSSETKGWYQAFFAPILLDSEQASSLGLKGMESTWHDNWLSKDEVEFAVLLPGFVLGQSTWEGGIGSVSTRTSQRQTAGFELPAITVFGVEPTCIVTPAGLVLHHKIKDADFTSAIMSVEFKPNQGLDEAAVVEASFLLKD